MKTLPSQSLFWKVSPISLALAFYLLAFQQNLFAADIPVEWLSNCQWLRPAFSKIPLWSKLSFWLWATLPLVAGLLIAAACLKKAQDSESSTFYGKGVTLLWLAILGILGWALGREDAVSTLPSSAWLLRESLIPNAQQPLLWQLGQGGLSYLLSLLWPVTDPFEVLAHVSRLYSLLCIALVYALARTWSGEVRIARWAALLAACSAPLLLHFASDTSFMRLVALQLTLLLAMTLTLETGSIIALVLLAPLTAFGLAFLPNASLASVVWLACYVVILIRSGHTPKRWWQTASLLLLGLAVGFWLRWQSGDVWPMPVGWGVSVHGQGASLFAVALWLAGATFAVTLHKPLLVLSAVLGGMMPFLWPDSGDWNGDPATGWVLAWLLSAPLVALGATNLSRMISDGKERLTLGFVALVLLPSLMADGFAPPTVFHQILSAQREALQLNQGERIRLYADPARPESESAFSPVLAPVGASLCLRPMDSLIADPEEFGERYWYREPRCDEEKPEKLPTPGSCRMISYLYELESPVIRQILYRDEQGWPQWVQSVSYWHVTDRRLDRSGSR